jgi:cytochrome bd-type quinol oxidase subunit 2
MKIANLIIAISLMFGLVAAVPSTQVYADAVDDLCAGANCDPDEDGSRVSGAIETTINIFSIIVGIVAVIMLIIGGLKYITSAGDASSIASAKNTIIYAIVGLIVVVLAQAIIRFVIVRTETPPSGSPASGPTVD